MWAIVPLKSPEHAKSRLATVLGATQRRTVFFQLAATVLDGLRAMPEITAVAVVTASDEVARFAQAHGAEVIREPQERGTTSAFAFGLAALQPRALESVLMMPGDLPLIHANAVRELLRAGREAEVVLVPDRRGTGTNALLLRPPHRIAPSFGPGSLARHCALAGAAGASTRILALEALAFDLDVPQDWAWLQARDAVTGTRSERAPDVGAAASPLTL